MKKTLINILKIGIPVAFGIGLTWWIYQGFSDDEINKMVEAFDQANYGWILFSVVFALASHLSRAWRWQYPLAPLGLKPRLANSFFTVMIGYFVNLAIPRFGEVTRCVVMSRYEKLPFNKLFGTVVAERIADLLLLVSFIFMVIYFQIEKVRELMGQKASKIYEDPNDIPEALRDQDPTIGDVWMTKVPDLWLVLVGLGVMIGGLIFTIWFLKRKQSGIVAKVQDFVRGLVDGVKSILTMKGRWAFIAHTIFIWAMYILMFYVCFFALPSTENVPFAGILTAFVMGGISIVLVPGGLGLYPVMIALTLDQYGVDYSTGFAFGWIVWTAQTLLIIVVGGLSFPAIAIYNKGQND